MSVTPDEVRHVARLARIAVSDEEVEKYARDLSSIVGHMAALERADVPAGGESGGSNAVLRGDEPRPAVEGTIVHAEFAPEWRDGFFLVPRLGSHEQAGS
ncbi:MAG: Asp-tRNA(Asn)/Glu-tRNA(Gln) amidotransferase subunit GatC [Gemmatimonadota bacterium]